MLTLLLWRSHLIGNKKARTTLTDLEGYDTRLTNLLKVTVHILVKFIQALFANISFLYRSIYLLEQQSHKEAAEKEVFSREVPRRATVWLFSWETGSPWAPTLAYLQPGVCDVRVLEGDQLCTGRPIPSVDRLAHLQQAGERPSCLQGRAALCPHQPLRPRGSLRPRHPTLCLVPDLRSPPAVPQHDPPQLPQPARPHGRPQRPGGRSAPCRPRDAADRPGRGTRGASRQGGGPARRLTPRTRRRAAATGCAGAHLTRPESALGARRHPPAAGTG